METSSPLDLEFPKIKTNVASERKLKPTLVYIDLYRLNGGVND